MKVIDINRIKWKLFLLTKPNLLLATRDFVLPHLQKPKLRLHFAQEFEKRRLIFTVRPTVMKTELSENSL